jgi:acyl transferase domain-containing protein
LAAVYITSALVLALPVIGVSARLFVKLFVVPGHRIEDYLSYFALTAFVPYDAVILHLSGMGWERAKGDSRSNEELEEKLKEGEADNKSFTTRPTAAPVILCFGGQVSKYVGIDHQTYESSKLLRKHLHDVNDFSKSLGGPEISPAIFDKDPIEDTVELQMCLFASQYACAKTWMDCGLEVASVVGHSFGKLTAMCVSGTLSLEDAVEMIQGRARLIRDSWGVEKGAMIAAQEELGDIMKLLARANSDIREEASTTIACFNGPQSFTLAGPAASIDEVERVLGQDAALAGIVKSKRLSITHAFHSRLAEPLRSSLEDLGRKLAIRKPMISLERAIENST